jgi:hypothetical protein
MASLSKKTKTESSPTTGLFSPKTASKPRLLSVPSGAASAFVVSAANSVANKTMSAANSAATMIPASVSAASVSAANLSAATMNTLSPPSSKGVSFFRYILVFLILAFLGLNLFLFFIKPANTPISQLYAPVVNFFNMRKAPPPVPVEVKAKEADSALKKIEKAVDKDIKKLPVIPEADDTIQPNKPLSKAGFCYIGEDRGVRSCIDVGEGDVCMSGDIFPSQAICINPNLRE